MSLSTVAISMFDAEFTMPKITMANSAISIYTLTPKSQMEDGGIEYAITLNKKPPANSITIPFTSKNLAFHYQPPLTEELDPANYDSLTETEAIKGGKVVDSRPENVVGSYAVFHASKKGNEYKTGKLFHIYRPRLTDAKGTSIWAALNIDSAKSTLTISVPQVYLDSATYPVVIDPTFGKTTIGASNAYRDGNLFVSVYNLSEAGTITLLTVYTKWGSYGKGCIYSDGGDSKTPSNLLTSSAQTNLADTNWTDLDVSDYVAAAGNYWLGLHDGNDCYYYYDAGANSQFAYKDATYASGVPASFGTHSHQNRAWSVYATYTASGGGLSVPVAFHHLKSMNNAHVTD